MRPLFVLLGKGQTCLAINLHAADSGARLRFVEQMNPLFIILNAFNFAILLVNVKNKSVEAMPNNEWEFKVIVNGSFTF